MTTHHPIFSKFERVKSLGTGRHVFDFLGSATDVSFRRGWQQHAVRAGVEIVPGYPPVNEHYFDWVATLQAVDRCRGTFRMAELGAGWAPWLVRAALAARQRPAITGLELVGIEADETHYRWVQQHFAANGVVGDGIHALRGAVAAQAGMIRFPKIANPDENYGASTRSAGTDSIEVRALSLGEVLGLFTGPLDFLHVDIQGAEYEVIESAIDLLDRRVRMMMVGTHISLEMHRGLAERLLSAGWRQTMNFDRNAKYSTEFGEVQFGDGFLLFENTRAL